MGYYSGTSTGPNDLIDKLRIALLAESWTVDDFSAVGAGYRLHVHKTLGGEVCYFNFRSAIAETGTTLITEDNMAGADGTVTGIIMNGSTGYDAGELWHKQPGYPLNGDSKSYGCCMTPMSVSAIPAYYFFFNGDSVHIVVEITAGKFQFMSFGMFVKQGTYTGGRYFSASIGSYRPVGDYMGTDSSRSQYAPRYLTLSGYAGYDVVNGAVYITADSTTSWRRCSYTAEHQIVFSAVGGGGNGGYDEYCRRAFCSMFWSKAPNFYNTMAAMAPIYTFLKRDDDNYSLLGWPEGVRFLNVTNYDSGDEVPYGDETWVVFKNDGVNNAQTNPYAGFAFLKDE